MKKINNIGVAALMLIGVSNFALATSDVPFIEGVTTYDSPGLTAVKISTIPNVVWSQEPSINSALAVLPKGFGNLFAFETFLPVIVGGTDKMIGLIIDSGAPVTEIPYVSLMQFFGGAVSISIEDGSPFLTPPFPTLGGIALSSNVIAASASALVSGAKVNTEIGSVVVYNSTTKTLETIDGVVVSLTRL